MEATGIRSKAEKGVFSMLLSNLGTRAVRAVSTVILMRLMGPDQFGIIAFAVIFKEMILLFSSWGVGDAVIQKKGDSGMIASAQFLTFVRSFLFFCVLFLLAPLAASFFSTPEVTTVVRISALLILIAPIDFVPRLLMRMDLRFPVLGTINLISAVANASVAIISAANGFGYLSIVHGNVAATVTRIVASWIAQPAWVNPMKASLRSIREILGFGYNLTLSGIVSWIYLNIDDLIVGKLLGKAVLGLYSKAYWLATLPSDTLGRVLYDVTFPVYAKLTDDRDKLRKAFLEVYSMNLFFSLPAITGIMVLSSPIVTIVFGKEWVSMIPILAFTCIVGLLRAVYGQANSIFKAVGRPDYYWKGAAVQALIVVTLGYWLTVRFGVNGMLSSLVVAMTWGLFIYSYIAFKRVLSVSIVDYLSEIRCILLSTLIMGLITYLARPLVSNVYALVGQIVASALAYFLLVRLLGGRKYLENAILMTKRILRVH